MVVGSVGSDVEDEHIELAHRSVGSTHTFRQVYFSNSEAGVQMLKYKTYVAEAYL